MEEEASVLPPETTESRPPPPLFSWFILCVLDQNSSFMPSADDRRKNPRWFCPRHPGAGAFERLQRLCWRKTRFLSKNIDDFTFGNVDLRLSVSQRAALTVTRRGEKTLEMYSSQHCLRLTMFWTNTFLSVPYFHLALYCIRLQWMNESCSIYFDTLMSYSQQGCCLIKSCV